MFFRRTKYSTVRIQRAIVAAFCKFPGRVRNVVYRCAGINYGDADIRYNVLITNPEKLIVGKHCLINSNVSFIFGASNETIELGDNVFIGPGCLLTVVTHQIGDSSKRAGNNVYRPIRIEDGVWIGANCTILPGVTIGKGSVVGAGALVNKDVPPNVLVVGVPARIIRQLDNCCG